MDAAHSMGPRWAAFEPRYRRALRVVVHDRRCVAALGIASGDVGREGRFSAATFRVQYDDLVAVLFLQGV